MFKKIFFITLLSSTLVFAGKTLIRTFEVSLNNGQKFDIRITSEGDDNGGWKILEACVYKNSKKVECADVCYYREDELKATCYFKTFGSLKMIWYNKSSGSGYAHYSDDIGRESNGTFKEKGTESHSISDTENADVLENKNLIPTSLNEFETEWLE